MSAADTFEPGLIGQVAELLRCDLNERLSKPNDARYGSNGSLSIKLDDNTFYDHEQIDGGGLLAFIVREGEAKTHAEAATWLKSNGFLSTTTTPAPTTSATRSATTKTSPKAKTNNSLGAVVARYDYCDENGEILMQVRRYDPKNFRQYSPDAATPNGWKANIKGVRQVPYRLPELLQSSLSQSVYIVEGEKDANRLAELGLVATTCAGGSKKWRAEHSKHLQGRQVVIVPDNDAPGRAHAQQVAESLQGIAQGIRVLTLPGLPEKGDVSDWLDAGGTREQLEALPTTAPTKPAAEATDDDAAPHASEMELAEQFAKQCAHQFRWTPGMDWLHNEGAYWTRDDHLRRYTVVKGVCKGAAATIEKPGFAAKVCSAATSSAVLSLARSEAGITTKVEEWDADPMLLNTPGEAYDLATGRPVSRDGLLFTQVTSVAPAATPTPIWDKFLLEVFAGDLEMVEFMQRLAGYSLTGSIKEQKLFFLYGEGANGKSVFLDVLRAIGGRYSHNLPSEALMTAKHERHPTTFAALQGKRLAVSSEIEESSHWAESRIKSLTGDATITARYMRGDEFTFPITHKHILAGNFKPRLKGDDFAMARRMVLIHFAQRFDGVRRDEALPEKLAAEYPGILAWAIEGARKWAAGGLAVPGEVLEASKEYMSEQNDLELWIGECCDTGDNLSSKSSDLYQSFAAWKVRNGEVAGSSKTFSQRLERHYKKKKLNTGAHFAGLAPKPYNDFGNASDYEKQTRGF